MNIARKVIAVLIVIFIGIPTLFGIIWAVGFTRAVVSPKFLSDLPQKIITEVPNRLDGLVRDVLKESRNRGERSRMILEAINKSDVSLKELMNRTGVMAWLDRELNQSFRELGRILRGEVEIHRITLNMRPLKEALRHQEMEKYFYSLLEKLPPCSETELNEWRGMSSLESGRDKLPACHPTPEVASEAWEKYKNEINLEIPNEVDFIETPENLPHRFNIRIIRFFVSLSYLLFIIPGLFIMGAALIGTKTKTGFFRWTGMSTMIGGLLTLGFTLFIRKILPIAIHDGYFWNHFDSFHRLDDVIVFKFSGLFSQLFENLFQPVSQVAGAVTIVGLIIFALSYAFHENKRKGIPAGSAPQQ